MTGGWGNAPVLLSSAQGMGDDAAGEAIQREHRTLPSKAKNRHGGDGAKRVDSSPACTRRERLR